MRKIAYEYNPLHGRTLSPMVIEKSSSVWHSLRPTQELHCAAAAAAAAAEGLNYGMGGGWLEEKLLFTPHSYVATCDFLLKPQEWLVILFRGPSSQGFRPDILYNIKPNWSGLRLEVNPQGLGFVVQNVSPTTNLFVHRTTRLSHLLQSPNIESCFTLVSEKELNNNNNDSSSSDSSDMDDDDDKK